MRRLAGTEFKEVHKKAFALYRQIISKSRRRPYVRSIYFKKQKIFLNLFWHHLWDKYKWQDRMRRLQYFAAALDLIQYSSCDPQSKENPNNASENPSSIHGSL